MFPVGPGHHQLQLFITHLFVYASFFSYTAKHGVIKHKNTENDIPSLSLELNLYLDK